MLLWHKHDVEKSLADLANFTPFPDEWTVEDKVLFEQAFSFHGKSFHRIQQMVSGRRQDGLYKSHLVLSHLPATPEEQASRDTAQCRITHIWRES